jgi:NADH dehydrogenase/NADH:ubiquinone oxidoreductase subunit G
MSFNNSITPADGSGNNITVGVRNNEILRVEPNANMNVNHYWLTDDQRLNHFEFVNNNRVTEPVINSNGKSQNVSWDIAANLVATTLANYNSNEIFVVASSRATNEDNFILNKFAKNIIKTNNIDYLNHFDEKFEDGFLSSGDRNPNTTDLGFCSWIADSYPDEVAMWAAAIVFARSGFAEMAADFQRSHIEPFKGMLIDSHMLGNVV